jgi:hypothetical protein
MHPLPVNVFEAVLGSSSERYQDILTAFAVLGSGKEDSTVS